MGPPFNLCRCPAVRCCGSFRLSCLCPHAHFADAFAGHVICEDDISLVTQSARCPSCRQPFVPGAKGNIRKLFLEFETEPRPSLQSASILPAAQQEEVKFLSALMRDLGIDAPANGALSLDSVSSSLRFAVYCAERVISLLYLDFKALLTYSRSVWPTRLACEMG